jgi:dihydroorotate dehydrogenase
LRRCGRQGIEALLGAGFAFVEIGSVCKEPQPGNPKPRVFRLREDAAVINRYGFNTEGADAVEPRLQRYRAKRADRRGLGVVGVNVGKNKWVEEADAVRFVLRSFPPPHHTTNLRTLPDRFRFGWVCRQKLTEM